jgi:8-oxo-dGTP pyrophosphatase MutT (NUDIX family)
LKVLQSELTNIISGLKEALSSVLPGEKAHRMMIPQGRNLYPTVDITSIKQSSILILLFPFDGKVSTCLIRRPSTMRFHGGQIAFPGGKYETFDKDILNTALRESFEEIGTDSDLIEIIGALTPLYVQVSNFTINPFIGWSKTLPQFKIESQEVDEIFIVPVERFLQHSTIQIREVTTIRGTIEVPGFYIDQLFIWGATAMIISEFNEIFRTTIDRQLHL